jgi:hypothetical protein
MVVGFYGATQATSPFQIHSWAIRFCVAAGLPAGAGAAVAGWASAARLARSRPLRIVLSLLLAGVVLAAWPPGLRCTARPKSWLQAKSPRLSSRHCSMWSSPGCETSTLPLENDLDGSSPATTRRSASCSRRRSTWHRPVIRRQRGIRAAPAGRIHGAERHVGRHALGDRLPDAPVEAGVGEQTPPAGRGRGSPFRAAACHRPARMHPRSRRSMTTLARTSLDVVNGSRGPSSLAAPCS